MKKASDPCCPCGSGKRYQGCCFRWHAGESPPSPEALMRSRYTAYVFGIVSYLRDSWHPRTRPDVLDLNGDKPLHWLGLEIRRCHTLSPSLATVEFVARYRLEGRGFRLHEVSRFERLDEGRWVYVDGDILP